MNKYIITIVSLLSVSITRHVAAQTQSDTLAYPVIGQPIADFTLHNITYYSKKQANIKEFRGRWLLLDFWSVGCSACIAGFPANNEIQKQLGDRLQVMLVGQVYPNAQGYPKGDVRVLYKKFRERENLVIPCAFDSSTMNAFGIEGVPRIFLIDPNGIVRAVSWGISLNTLKEFLKGNTPYVPERTKYFDYHQNPYNHSKPFGINNNGAADSDFIFRSIITKWKAGMDHYAKASPEKGAIDFVGLPNEWLYNYAYTGKFDWGWKWEYKDVEDSLMYIKYLVRPIVEGIPDTIFRSDGNTFKNIYCYSLRIPANISQAALQQAMQKDLKICFGYNASLETRICPYWKLVALPGAEEKLKTKGGKPAHINYDLMGESEADYELVNRPFKELYQYVAYYTADTKERREISDLIVDETGITENIDIKMNCSKSGFQSVVNALRTKGLDLVKGEKEMKVVVIRPGK